LQEEADSLRENCELLASAMQELIQEIDGAINCADVLSLNRAAESLEQSNAALMDEMAALKQAKKSRDLEGVRKGLDRLIAIVADACSHANDTIDMIGRSM
jgi:soluble cytochrome b562